MPSHHLMLVFFSDCRRGHISLQILNFLIDQLMTLVVYCPWTSTDQGHGMIFFGHGHCGNPTASFVFQVFQCQARKEKELCAWGAGNGSPPMVPNGCVWIWGIHGTVYPYNGNFIGTTTIKHGIWGSFQTKPLLHITPYIQNIPVTVTLPRRCIDVFMNYTYNPKERGSAVRTLIDERKMTFYGYVLFTTGGWHSEAPRHISLTWF